jgi:glycosyltransferase involved in cell wall biosynthesis
MTGSNGIVSIVMPILNGAKTVARQIDAVIAERTADTEIVLVDNGSTDGTLEILRRYEQANTFIRVVVEARRGVNFARNAGVAASTGNKILLCDCDDVVQPGWLGALSEALDNADLVGGKLDRVDTIGRPVGDGPYIPDNYSEFGWGLTSPWGANCGFRRDVWEQFGGFDPRISGGGDEVDFFMRAQITGSSLAWVPDAVVTYTVPEDPTRLRIQRTRQNSMNLARVYWFGRLRGWPRTPMVLADIIKASILLPLAPFSSHWRGVFMWRVSRRWFRLKGMMRFLPGEISRRPHSGTSEKHLGNLPHRRFAKTWKEIAPLEGSLERPTAAALHRLASTTRRGAAIAMTDATDTRTRSTLELASADSGTVVIRSDAARHSGPPVGFLYIDGATEIADVSEVIDRFNSWVPNLTPDASIVFGNSSQEMVRVALLRLRPELPSCLLRFGELSMFVHV